MSRDLRFRAWDFHNKCMTIGSTKKFIIITNSSGLNDSAFEAGYELMQYTGLVDKHSMPIYEQDVVYIAGYGDCVMEFPFIELYEALGEDDIGAILGNTFETEKYIGMEN